jgi:hypothetical protein
MALCRRSTVRLTMKVSAEPFGCDPDGNPRVIAVLLGSTQDRLVVWHSPQEYARLWAGVESASAKALTGPFERPPGPADGAN